MLNLHPQLNSNAANSMINALNGTSNSLLHQIGNGFVNSQNQVQSHNSSQNSLNGTNGRSYMSCSPHSSSSDSTSPHLNVNSSLNSNTSANSSSAGSNNNHHCNSSVNNSTNSIQSTNGILSINKNMMNNTDHSSDERNSLSLELGLNAKNSLSAFYSNGQSLLSHNLIAAYHEQNGRRNSSDDHEEENNINNLNSLIVNQNETADKLEQSGSMMNSLELMDKCRLNNHFNSEKTFGHLGVNTKQTLSEQECAALNATLEKANRLFEENLGQSNSLPFKLRHKTRNSPSTTDHTSDTSSEGLDSPSSGKFFD